MMNPINNFRGLVTSLGDVLPGAAASTQNFIRHRKRGWLSASDGYYKKYVADTDQGLPQISDAGKTNFIEPTVHKVSNLSWKDIHSFYVPEHGGRNIAVAVATYRKTGFTSPATTKDRIGIFVRPYWNGSAWVDLWRELTEMFIFEIVELPGGGDLNKLVIGNGATWDFTVEDPGQLVFTDAAFSYDNYMYGWTIAYGDFNDHENFDRVHDTGYISSNKFYLDIGHPNTDFGGRPIGTKLWVYRNFLYRDVPESLESFIYNLFNEIRFTSGPLSTDVSLLSGMNEKGRDLPFYANGLVLSEAALDQWQYGVVLAAEADNVVGADPLATGTYYLKYALKMDDGSITKLFDAFTDTLYPTLDPTNSYVITNALANRIEYQVYVSKGALSRRVKSIVIFISNDNVNFNYLAEHDIDTYTGTAVVTLNVSTGYEHVYGLRFASDQTINDTEFTNAGEAAASYLGRSTTDTGIVRWKTGTVIGRKSIIGNVYIGSKAQPNLVMINAASGAGVYQSDIFPNDGVHQIDLEFSDGDAIVGMAPTGERWVVLKGKSVVLISPRGDGSYSKDILSQNIGCSSMKSIVTFNETVYWCDHNGRYSFGPQGLRVLDLLCYDDWRALSDANRSAAVSSIDKENMLWYISAGGYQWIFDIESASLEGDPTGQWMRFAFTDTPVRMSVDANGSIDFITADGKLLTINNPDGSAWGFNGANYTMSWKSREIALLRLGEGSSGSVHVKAFSVEYESDIAITMKIFIDESVTESISVTLAAGERKKSFRMPLGTMGSSFAFSLEATTSGDNPAIFIKSVLPIVAVRSGGGIV